jgi:hypothetical protein
MGKKASAREEGVGLEELLGWPTQATPSTRGTCKNEA